MIEHWALALPILLADVVNPVLFAAVVVAAGSSRPCAAGVAMVLGHTVAYFAVGVAVVYGLAELAARWLAPLIERFSAPEDIDFVVGLALGLILIGIALQWRMSPPKTDRQTASSFGFGVGGAFVLGAVINFVGAPFALPYFAFLSQLDRLAPEQPLMALAAYNVVYALPFLAVPLAVASVGSAVLPLLGKVVSVLERLSGFVPPVLLGLVGVGLVVDAALFFTTGTGLV
ncbi:MAG: hypothetical protein OXC84_08685 [Gammaproteobacteria bacterium]|nr:hypothetical protein [Gammaproteobacteria bacterium]